MNWILCAMLDEANIIIEKYNLKEIKTYKEISVYKWKNIVLVKGWIWKIQATMWTMILSQYGPFEKIINIWIAWNSWKEENALPWDVFLVDKVVQHDMYLPFEWEHLNYAKWEIDICSKINIEWADFNIFDESICATWDQFIDDENVVSQIVKKHNAHVVEMEAFAFLSVLREFNLLDKAYIIKSVSDAANEEARKAHESNLELAMINWVKVLEVLLN